MKEYNQKDITRYTLQSYAGVFTSDIELSSRQKEAIERLMHLSDDKFDGLCNDVVNEIQRRNGVESKMAGPMQEKLRRLNDEKFKNLVVDLLLVYNYRYPDGESVKSDKFLINLEYLITDLKIKSEREKFLIRSQNLSFARKIEEYNRYIRRLEVVDEEIIDEIDRSISEEMDKRAGVFVDVIGQPLQLIKIMDESSLKDNKEYLYHRKNILELVEGGSEGRLVKTELKQLLGLLVDNCDVPEDKTEVFYEEISTIINILNEIKKDVKEEASADLGSISDRIVEVVDSMIAKTEVLEDTDDFKGRLKLHRISMENLKDFPTKKDAFEEVVLFSNDVLGVFKRPIV